MLDLKGPSSQTCLHFSLCGPLLGCLKGMTKLCLAAAKNAMQQHRPAEIVDQDFGKERLTQRWFHMVPHSSTASEETSGVQMKGLLATRSLAVRN